MKKTETHEFLPLLFALGFMDPVAVFASSESVATDDLAASDKSITDGATADKPSTVATKLKKTTKKSSSASATKRATKKTSAAKTAVATTPEAEQPAKQAPEPAAYEGPYSFNPNAITTSDDLFLALEEPDITELTLVNDIFVNQDVEIDHDLTINLNHYHIISFQEGAHVLDIKAGAIHLKGSGQIHAMGNNATAVRIKGATASQANYATITIDPDIKVYAPHYYGIYIAPNFDAAYGVTVNFAGHMTARDGIFLHGNIRGRGENLPTVNIQDGAIIEVDETVGIAAQADGYGAWQIGAATLTGATGLKVKAGQFTLANTQVMALGEPLNEQGWSNNFYGVGAALQIESDNERSGNITIKISGDQGKYQSAESYVFAEYGNESDQATLEKLEIMDGEFAGHLGVFYGLISEAANGAVQVKGGKFSTEISRYLASDYYLYLEKDDAGRYVVQGNTAIDEEVDEEQQKLNVALAKLINVVAQAEHFVSPEYHAGNFGSLQKTIEKTVKRINKALKKPYDILAHQDEAELPVVASEITNLEQAINEMQETENILRAELAETADEAAYNRHRYTKDSYADLAEIIKRSEELLGREELNLSDIDAMLGEIDAAKMLLEECTDDDEEEDELPEDLPVVPIEDLLPKVKTKTLADAKTELSNLLVEIDSLSVLDYTPDSLAVLLELAMAAEQILRDEVDGLTIADLEETIENLNTARASLELATEDDEFTDEFVDEVAEDFVDDELMDAEVAEDTDLDENIVEASAEDEARLLAIFEEADIANELDDDLADDTEEIMEEDELDEAATDDSVEMVEDSSKASSDNVTSSSENVSTSSDNVSLSLPNTSTRLINMKTNLPNMTTSLSNVPTNLVNASTSLAGTLTSVAGEAQPVIKPMSELDQAKESLQTLLDEARELKPEDYTSESYAAFAEAISEASRLLQNNSVSVSAEIISSLAEVVQSTKLGLVAAYTPADEARDNLITMLEAVQNLTVNDYFENTASQFGELQVAISKAHAILAHPTAELYTIVAVMDEIKIATSGLKGGEETLRASLANLRQEISESERLAVDDYTEASYADFQATLERARKTLIIENPRFAEIDDMTAELKLARTKLITRPADWTVLQAQIKEISKLDRDNYMATSYDVVLEVLNRAKAMLSNPATTQKAVDDLGAELNTAIKNLVLKPAHPAESLIMTNDNPTAPNWNLSSYNQAPAGYYTPRPNGETAAPIPPNFLMSVMAGAYAGLAAYRRSRLDAKHRKQQRTSRPANA